MLKKYLDAIDANEKLSAEEKASFKKFYTDFNELAKSNSEKA